MKCGRNFQTFRGKMAGTLAFLKMEEAHSSENSAFVKIFIQIHFREGLIMIILEKADNGNFREGLIMIILEKA
jgi:hypothetical protein